MKILKGKEQIKILEAKEKLEAAEREILNNKRELNTRLEEITRRIREYNMINFENKNIGFRLEDIERVADTESIDTLKQKKDLIEKALKQDNLSDKNYFDAFSEYLKILESVSKDADKEIKKKVEEREKKEIEFEKEKERLESEIDNLADEIDAMYSVININSAAFREDRYAQNLFYKAKNKFSNFEDKREGQ